MLGIPWIPSDSLGFARIPWIPLYPLGFARIPWIPSDSGVFAGSTGVRWDPLESAGIRWGPFGSAGGCWDPLGSAGVRWDPLGPIPLDSLGFPRPPLFRQFPFCSASFWFDFGPVHNTGP